MIDNYKCQICDNSSFSYLHKGVDRLYGVEGAFDFYRCNICRLIFIFPTPGEDALKKYYPDDYYSYITAEKTEAEGGSLRQKAIFYFRHPFKFLNCVLYSKLLNQKDILEYKKGLNVLDVGCGDGKYLLDKRRYGCDCFGIDIDEKALSRLREKDNDVKTYRGNLWEAGLTGESFDVVNINNVLEHVGEPEKLLSEVKKIMKKGAILRVVVPNSASLTHWLFRKYWMGIDIPRHLYTFSIKNLKILFKKTDLTIQYYRTIENSHLFIVSTIYVINEFFKKNLKAMECSKIWNNEFLKLLFSPYAFIVNALKIGGMVEFILKKD